MEHLHLLLACAEVGSHRPLVIWCLEVSGELTRLQGNLLLVLYCIRGAEREREQGRVPATGPDR